MAFFIERQKYVTPTQFFLANFEVEFVYVPAKLSCIYFLCKLPFVVKYVPFHQKFENRLNTFLQLLHGHC